MSIATIIAVAAIVVAFGLVGALVAWTFARMPFDIRQPGSSLLPR